MHFSGDMLLTGASPATLSSGKLPADVVTELGALSDDPLPLFGCPGGLRNRSDRQGLRGVDRVFLMERSRVSAKTALGLVIAFLVVVSAVAGPDTAAAVPSGIPSGFAPVDGNPASPAGLSHPGLGKPVAARLPARTTNGGSRFAQGSGLSVSLAVGESAQGWVDSDYGECRSVHCRHLDIGLRNAPAGDYDVACWSSRDSEPWYTGTWRWPGSELWSNGGCWFGFPGEQVWVVINGDIKSNVVTWPHGSSQTGTRTASFIQVSAGSRHSCGLRSDGSVVCWGYNYWGQADAPSGSFTQVSAGSHHSCGLRSDGSVVCWGYNYWGKADAPSGSFTQVSADGTHSCGLRSDGSVVCWGDNEHGQADAPSGSFTQVSGGYAHSCGLRSDGSVVCWGDNRSGQADAPSGSFTQVSSGGNHSCGLRSDGSVVCWGDNRSGKADAPSGSFIQVSSSGYAHSCGLRSDGSVVCWGSSSQAPSGSFTQVSSGGIHSCGLRSDGSVVCWGDNRLGQADAPSGSFTQVSAGGTHSCGLRSDGSVVCRGDNSGGQADALSGSFTQVSAGGTHSCGLRSDESVVCWGNNRLGQADAPSGFVYSGLLRTGPFVWVAV